MNTFHIHSKIEFEFIRSVSAEKDQLQIFLKESESNSVK